MPEVRLTGCGARPLAGYLKALGVLRVLARQVDRSTRARWGGTGFELHSDLTEDELRTFFSERFAPSPILSPWNGRSGFYERGGTAAVGALASIEQSSGDRLRSYRALIGQTREILLNLGLVEKPAERDKERLVRALRERWPDTGIEWLDAAIVIAGEGPAYPPLLGSGGNEGSYDFSSNYMQALREALEGKRSAELLDASLLGSSAQLERLALAHLQGDASPTNSPKGDAGSLGNPWDLVLAVEGSLSLVGGAARRHADGAKGLMTAPFTVRATAAGYGGAVAGEKGRAEIWLPIWRGWASHSEIGNLIRESRAQVRSGHGMRSARSGLDFARAAGELGVARGIDAFERYTILERYGQTNLAVPAGRIQVAPRPAAAALQSIDPWTGALLRFAGTDHCPNGVRIAIRQLERSCFDLAARGRPEDAIAALEHLGAAEAALARSGTALGSGLRPLRNAPAAPWVSAADDRSAEFALAVSIGSLNSHARNAPDIRDYLHGTRKADKAMREFDPDRRHLLSASSAVGLLAAIHARSHLDAARAATRAPENRTDRLGFEWGTWCDPRVTRLLVDDKLDADRAMRLVHGLAMLDHRGQTATVKRRGDLPPAPVPAYDALALAWWRRSDAAGPVDDVQLGPRPGWAARLAAGSVAPVLQDALLRLRVAGLPLVPDFRDLATGAPRGELLAAALLVPVGERELAALERRLVLKDETDTNREDD